jgi:DNA polymerase III delta prime subunit
MIKEFMKMNIIKLLFISKQSNGKTSYIRSIINDYYGKGSENVLMINNIREYGVNYFKNEVVQFCRSPSLTNKKKMIVLDDFDYLNDVNQHIFKNIIENYDINYILTCSTPQKVLESVQSMLYIIELNKMSRQKLSIIYDQIKENERLSIDEETKEYITHLNVKQMINSMEKFKLLNEPITIEIAKELSSDIHPDIFRHYIEEYQNKNLAKCIKILYNLYNEGYSVMDILYNFYEYTKTTDWDFSQHICKYIIAFHNIHEDIIELALFTNSIFKNIL